MPEQVQRYGRWLTAQQKDERRHDNSDRRRLARQYLSDLLHSLTHERDRWRAARHHLDRALSFTILNFPHARRQAHDVHVYT